jgi:hypothetical protein
VLALDMVGGDDLLGAIRVPRVDDLREEPTDDGLVLF